MRLSSNFKTAITEPSHFFGRGTLLENVREDPFRVRVLLGGRRVGKTSTLRALEWTMLDCDSHQQVRAFPVFIDLKVEQPQDLDNFRYLLIVRLREALSQWRQSPGQIFRDKYREFLRRISPTEVIVDFPFNVKARVCLEDNNRKLENDAFRKAFLQTIDELRKNQFEGVCFLIDEAEFVVSQSWANDAWSYFRGLKDSDMAIHPFLGLVISGYRALKAYQQDVGSPLYNIADPEWLRVLTEEEIQELIEQRGCDEKLKLIQLSDTLIEYAGCHPYLTNQLINAICDNYRQQKFKKFGDLLLNLIKANSFDFSIWWNDKKDSESFTQSEKAVYKALINCRYGTVRKIAKQADMDVLETLDSLEILSGAGVIRQRSGSDSYMIGAKIFESWVSYQMQ